jgi:hypothetical protein
VAQRVGTGITLLFHDRGTRRELVVSSMTRPQFTPGKDPVPIVQEDSWAPGPVLTGRKPRPQRDSIPDHPASSQSLKKLRTQLKETSGLNIKTAKGGLASLMMINKAICSLMI